MDMASRTNYKSIKIDGKVKVTTIALKNDMDESILDDELRYINKNLDELIKIETKGIDEDIVPFPSLAVTKISLERPCDIDYVFAVEYIKRNGIDYINGTELYAELAEFIN